MTKKRRRAHHYVETPRNIDATKIVLKDMNNLLIEMSKDISPIKNEWIEAGPKLLPLFYSYMGAIEDLYYEQLIEQIKVVNNNILLFQKLFNLLLLPSRSFVHQRSIWVNTQGHSGVCIHSRIRRFLFLVKAYQPNVINSIISKELYTKLKSLLIFDNDDDHINNHALNRLLEYHADDESPPSSPSRFLIDTDPPLPIELISCALLKVDDVVEYVLSFLELKDLCRALCVCKCFYRVGQHVLVQVLSDYFCEKHTLPICRHISKAEEFSYKGFSTLTTTLKEGDCTDNDTIHDIVGHCRYRYMTNKSRVPIMKS